MKIELNNDLKTASKTVVTSVWCATIGVPAVDVMDVMDVMDVLAVMTGLSLRMCFD